MNIKEILEIQRDSFKSGSMKNFQTRRKLLIDLKDAIKRNEILIYKALKEDLNKSSKEAYMTELGLVLNEITYILKHLKGWMKDKKVRTPIHQFPAKSYIISEAYGQTLIISAWNYPFLLSLLPLVGAIAAGNTCILKPADKAPNTAFIIKRIIKEAFDEGVVYTVLGGVDVVNELLEERFDYIFFTGSSNVGRIILTAAAKYLTPVSLELGGKSPAIVDETASINLTAKRLAWGKFVNAGQTCVAPDYLLVYSSIKKELISKMKTYLDLFYTDLDNYPKIISEDHLLRLKKLISSSKIIYGGEVIKETMQIRPTLVDEVGFDSPIMQDEIFGPILPIISYDNLDDVINDLKEKEKPLALYLFTNSKNNINKVTRGLSFGGGVINDSLVHLSSPYLGFGGIGNSGMGKYRGKHSFDTFTHYKGIMKRSNVIDLNLRYPPYNDIPNQVRRFLK